MGTPDPLSSSLRVAILSRSERERDCLAEILETNGLHIVSDDSFRQGNFESIDQSVADVILVNLDESDEDELDILIEQIELPLLFNDSASIRKQVTAGGRAWGRRLAEKLISLAGDGFSLSQDTEIVEEPAQTYAAEDEDDQADIFSLEVDEDLELIEDTNPVESERVVPYKDMPTAEIVALNKNGGLNITPNRAKRVWVLGASIGGPQAVKAFLGRLPEDLPVCFILAQHIGVGFVNLLAEQLSRVTALRVTAPEDDMVLEKGHVVVAPVEKRMNFSERGVISMEKITQRSIYSPSIDDVMTVVARHYGVDANAIIFSGMGNDGTAGCHLIAQKGGMVWAQEAGSCVISSMADSARSAGVVSRSGTPEELADNLVEYLTGEIT